MIGSLVAAGLLAAGGVAVGTGAIAPGDAWFVASAVAIIAAATAFAVVVMHRRRSAPFVSYMTQNDLRARIRTAQREIWSFQISGGEFTQTADQVYAQWLEGESDRTLKLLFANPDNEALLENIVKLSGMGKRSTPTSAIPYLRDTIKTSLRRYRELAERVPGRVDLRIYDFSPPCSIHAVDPRSGDSRASIFVENYLPRTGWVDRPCFLLTRRHRLFELYAKQCLTWFEDATPYRAADESPDELVPG